ncbi:hypothetical protein LOTGIDRAFT_232989 [Lottia gigantea]|uniref:Uncharacterized protein n=1 Tax=Lottia gigantea TaxID=225164 RepID=V3ZMC3_LOTGI|nr:hypothetical protein LOTGIDRAFT_232989 [Lottia gigantea]ESO92518.1 hypothetical protein LOTGIDRAFT_232989 [Lottia gigantea]
MTNYMFFFINCNTIIGIGAILSLLQLIGIILGLLQLIGFILGLLQLIGIISGLLQLIGVISGLLQLIGFILGLLQLIGVISEIIITAGGENIAPVPVEDTVKECLPCISNCMLIGDKCKFLSMFLTVKCQIDPETQESLEPLDKQAIEWCESIGPTLKLRRPIVVKMYSKEIEEFYAEESVRFIKVGLEGIVDMP